jgi:hypothetical protein
MDLAKLTLGAFIGSFVQRAVSERDKGQQEPPVTRPKEDTSRSKEKAEEGEPDSPEGATAEGTGEGH